MVLGFENKINVHKANVRYCSHPVAVDVCVICQVLRNQAHTKPNQNSVEILILVLLKSTKSASFWLSLLLNERNSDVLLQ